MSTSSRAEAINRQTMLDSVSWYASHRGLNAPEKSAFGQVAELARNKRVLDLGVGGGRTVAPLLDISTDYIGVDYVKEMVDECRRLYPGVRFEHADARSMPQFADHSFDLIVFACNGVSMVDHAGRLAILKEVRRLLAADGAFVFSTYNRNSPEHDRGFVLPDFSRTFNPLKAAVRGTRFTKDLGHSLFNRMRHRRHEVRTADYSILNDRCHNYATMLYYISMENQFRQLRELGFGKQPTVYDHSGAKASATSRDDSLTYVVPA